MLESCVYNGPSSVEMCFGVVIFSSYHYMLFDSVFLCISLAGDLRCQEVAAEVICLASALETATDLLAAVVSSGTLTTLLHAPSAGIRAAAASTMTKLSIKAKALSQDSAEVAQIMNTALTVLKSANSPASASLSSTSTVAAGWCYL